MPVCIAPCLLLPSREASPSPSHSRPACPRPPLPPPCPAPRPAVGRAVERSANDAALLSINNHWTSTAKKTEKRLDPREFPQSDFLMFTEDFSGMNFGELLEGLRPPKITPEQFSDLKDRVESLGKQPMREASSGQIISLLEKYDVIVAKEVVESLLKTTALTNGRRKPAAMTAKQWLNAPKPEAPPDWSLITCKGLHHDIYRQSKTSYQHSMHYKFGKMFHEDASVSVELSGGSRPGTQITDGLRSRSTSRLGTSHGMRLGTAHSCAGRRASTAMSTATITASDASADPAAGAKAKPPKAAFRSRFNAGPDFLESRSGDLSSLPWTTRTSAMYPGAGCDRKAATRAASGIKSLISAISHSTVAQNEVGKGAPKARSGRSTPWILEKPEVPHMCIDTDKTTYTTHATTPRQTLISLSQESMHAPRFVINELGSKLPMT